MFTRPDGTAHTACDALWHMVAEARNHRRHMFLVAGGALDAPEARLWTASSARRAAEIEAEVAAFDRRHPDRAALRADLFAKLGGPR